MKKVFLIIFSLLITLVSANLVIAKTRYHTYEVVEVTENTITLQRRLVSKNITEDGAKSYGSTVSATIDRSRRPYLKVGDRVRYNKRVDRMRRTLPRE
jgi:hypothetical protein